MQPDLMTQTAPFPTALQGLVAQLSYKPGWYVSLRHLDRGQGSEGLTLVININGPDTNNVHNIASVNHYLIVPAASYNEQSWRRWLFDQILLVEQHEAAEFFRIGGEQPFAPNHGPGYNPFIIRELTTAAERAINFRGEVVDA